LDAPNSIAIDATGNAWTANYSGNSLSKFSNAGVALSPSTGYIGGGLYYPYSIAIDGSGDAWIAGGFGISASLSKFSNAGVALSPSTGYTGGGLDYPVSVAIDGPGNAWIADSVTTVSEFSSAGTAISPSTGYISGGDILPSFIAIDGSGNAWTANPYGNSFSEFSSAGTALSPIDGYTSTGQSAGYVFTGLSTPTSIAIDGSGDVWITSSHYDSASEIIGAATPVITPICAGLPATPTANGTSNLGTRP
jgi:hypothetical protein